MDTYFLFLDEKKVSKKNHGLRSALAKMKSCCGKSKNSPHGLKHFRFFTAS